MVVGANFFGQIYGRIVVCWRNSDQIIQIMSRGLGGLGVGWGGGGVGWGHKCIFQ